MSESLNRRHLLQGLGAAAVTLSTPSLSARVSPASSGALALLRQPDAVRVFVGEAHEEAPKPLEGRGDRWSIPGVELTCSLSTARSSLQLHAPRLPIRRLHLRWLGTIPEDTKVLGDAWERSYGDLAWLPLQPERPLPWYCLLATSAGTHGYGVRTGAGAFAFWQADSAGLSLWLDLRNGGNGALLGDRILPLAQLVAHEGSAGESPFQATRALCRRMAPDAPLAQQRGGLPVNTLFGSNDWYYAYGKNTAEGILHDADLMRELAPTQSGAARPFTVIDDGYQDPRRFPDMAALAGQIASRHVVPGLWIRPLRAPSSTVPGLLLPAVRFGARSERSREVAYDPTVPEARAAVLAVVKQASAWGYQLLKHDFTTYELLGQWGSEMGASPTLDGWNFQDRSLTNAEIITAFYRDLRTAAGEDRLVLGCNTVGHLAAGIFDAQRTGDDVSGRDWERTRRMGVNTLAFRLPQHGSFFAIDADCVPITRRVPWSLTEQWLRAVAGSGTVLLISPEPGTIARDQRRALQQAFALAASGSATAIPEDWMLTRTPVHWQAGRSGNQEYRWVEPLEGASPFPV